MQLPSFLGRETVSSIRYGMGTPPDGRPPSPWRSPEVVIGKRGRKLKRGRPPLREQRRIMYGEENRALPAPATPATAAGGIGAGPITRPVGVLAGVAIALIIAVHGLKVIDGRIPGISAATAGIAAAVGISEAAGADVRGLCLVLQIVVAFIGGAGGAGQCKDIGHAGGVDGRDL